MLSAHLSTLKLQSIYLPQSALETWVLLQMLSQSQEHSTLQNHNSSPLRSQDK